MGPKRAAKRLKDREGAASAVFAAFGATFMLLGLTDVLLLWIPLQLDNPAWEFATFSRMLDGMPMIALGFGLVTYGAVAHPAAEWKHARLLAMAAAVIALVFLALGALYLTAVPAVLANTPPEAMDGVRRAILKSSVQLVAYCALFVSLFVVLWKRILRSS